MINTDANVLSYFYNVTGNSTVYVFG